MAGGTQACRVERDRGEGARCGDVTFWSRGNPVRSGNSYNGLSLSREDVRVFQAGRTQLLAVSGSTICTTSVMVVTGMPLNSACLWIVASSLAR